MTFALPPPTSRISPARLKKARLPEAFYHAADRAFIFECSKITQVSGRVTLSIDDISAPSLFDSSLAAELPSVTPVAAIPSSLDIKTASNSRDTSKQQALPPEDFSGAETDLDRFNEDLAPAAPTLSSDLGNDLTTLLKDLTSGNTSAAQADVSKVQADLQTRDASSVASAQNGSPLDSLIGKISDSLNSDSVHGAPQDGAQHDLINFLVENGQGTGSLINTSA
jgi:hypothetical protein